MEKMISTLKKEKEEMIAKREALKAEYRQMEDGN